MAIRDLIYACIECGREGGLHPDEKNKNVEVCDRCGTSYTRVEGARIRCTVPGREPETREPAEWVDLLASSGLVDTPQREQPVIVRISRTSSRMRAAGEYLGRIESFEPPLAGQLQLTDQALLFQPTTGSPMEWKLEQLTALQSSSTSLQLKIRSGPIVSIRFPEGSPLLWEARVRRAVQKVYTDAGRGEILEFQPRIVCR